MNDYLPPAKTSGSIGFTMISLEVEGGEYEKVNKCQAQRQNCSFKLETTVRAN